MRIRTNNYDHASFSGGPWVSYERALPLGLEHQRSSGSTSSMISGSHYQVIIDDLDNRCGVKEVSHEKIITSLDECLVGSYLADNGSTAVRLSGPYRLWNEIIDPVKLYYNRYNVVVVYPSTPEQLMQKAVQDFNKVNQVDNLLNILEADQLVSGVKDVGSFLVRAVNTGLVLTGRRAPSSMRGKLVKWSDISNMYLGWSFGFAPLISDIKKVIKALPKVRANLKALANQSSQPFTVTRSCEGTLTFTGDINSGWGPDANSDCTFYTELKYLCRPTLLVGVKGRRRPKYNLEELQQLDYLIARFLATGPASLTWERIPFSFVVDWFIDLQKIIDKMDSTLVGSYPRIEKSWTSEKYHTLISSVKKKRGTYDWPQDGTQIAQCELSYYHRKPMPPTTYVVEAGRFGKKQLSLTAALIHQQVANLRRSLRRR